MGRLRRRHAAVMPGRPTPFFGAAAQGQHADAPFFQRKTLQREPKRKGLKRNAEERAAILAKAAQAAFTSYDEQLDAQLDAEALLGLDSKRDKDKTYAWKLGQS